MEIKDIFIQNLRKYRRYRKISQMELAETCRTSTSYIGQIEIGNRFPSMELIDKIALALEIKPYLLFCDEQDLKMPLKESSSKGKKIPDSVKKELIRNLTNAIRKVIKQAK